MSKMKEFVAFRALVALLEQDGKKHLLEEAYHRCLKQEAMEGTDITNQVKPLYDEYTDEEISAKIAELITPPDITPEVVVIYQSIADLHKACPNHHGDWYFSGMYPTPGGTRVVNRAFVNYMNNSDARAY
jgi:amidophosphoribosyltransferase